MKRFVRIQRAAAFVVMLSLIASLASAQDWPWANTATNGFRQLATTVSVPPASEARPLLGPDKHPHAAQVPDFDDLIGRNKAKAILIADAKGLLAESYGFGVSARRTPLGFSMSKSLTALAVGHALCDGSIKTLEDPLEKYVPETTGTSWGRASIHDLLRMSSGAHPTASTGHKFGDPDSVLGRAILEGTMHEAFIDTMKRQDEMYRPPGAVFQYNNLDTTALAMLVTATSGETFESYFARKVWHPSGAASKGAWVVNNRGEVSAYQGFSATPHDWIRLGLYVLEQIEQTETCFGRFLQTATSRQIAAFGASNEYGYQIWVRCGPAIDFCFAGHGGQYLFFNRQHGIVIYQHATNQRLGSEGLRALMPPLIAALPSNR
jgi:CubicO group peptidase (beta-lactamase class C family)